MTSLFSRSSLYIPVYSLTLLLSAALLFFVQPMFSKMILPLLGGTPQVWNTAMLFFQTLLLAGYAYAHLTSRFLNIRVQAGLHILLLVLFFFVLPITIPEGAAPPLDKDPTLWQLTLMTFRVGGPFFVLAASAPMLQRWFANTAHPDGDNPYFLYAASNFGSVTALLAYPVVFEPLLDLPAQSHLWQLGYALLIGFTVAAALIVGTEKPLKKKKTKKKAGVITWKRRAFWLLLTFIPSSLMLGVTTFITTDIASAPLLWVVPLALYVGTFIIAFSRKPIITKKRVATIQGFLIIGLIGQVMGHDLTTIVLLALHLSLFFFAALNCHMELADSKPEAAKLTEFYLFVSIGGALGGFFNAIIAPQFFTIALEYPLVLIASCFMLHASQNQAFFKKPKFEFIVLGLILAFCIAGLFAHHALLKGILTLCVALCLGLVFDRRWPFALAVTICILFFPPGHMRAFTYVEDVLYQGRNFFGILRVSDTANGERFLMHGTTNHGAQALDPEYRLTPISYYSKQSPVSDIFTALDNQKGGQNIAVLGLGIGVMSCFTGEDRHFDFFEINPEVIHIAENTNYFTFLSDCGSPYDIIQGDGRLMLAKQPDHSYDAIFLDAFSSDNIPVHLMTEEAAQMYLTKLKPGGIVVFHVSNNHLDLEPVVAAIAKEMDIPAYGKLSLSGKIEGADYMYYMAHFVALTKNEDFIKALKAQDWSPAKTRDGIHAWTDKFSNIISVLNSSTGAERLRKRKKEREAKEKAEN